MSGKAKTAEKRSKKSPKVETRTPEQIISDIRKNAPAGLAVTSADIVLLLQGYDQAHALLKQTAELLQSATASIQALDAQVKDLQAKNEEFRAVYEQENRRDTLTIEVIPEAGKGPGLENIPDLPGVSMSDAVVVYDGGPTNPKPTVMETGSE